MKQKMKTREICQYIPCGQTEHCDSECYIKRLEEENAALIARVETAEKERDAAECCISNMVAALVCRNVCVNKTELCIMNNPYCKGFEWRGPKDGEKGEEG